MKEMHSSKKKFERQDQKMDKPEEDVITVIRVMTYPKLVLMLFITFSRTYSLTFCSVTS